MVSAVIPKVITWSLLVNDNISNNNIITQFYNAFNKNMVFEVVSFGCHVKIITSIFVKIFDSGRSECLMDLGK